MEIKKLVRKNILELKPYTTARDEFQGFAEVYLDANENPYPERLNRYPDPLQSKLKEQIALLKGVPASKIFLGNGSDEPIELLIRAFCEPYKESILTTSPTYGMYSVSASSNAVPVIDVPLNENFDLIPGAVNKATKPGTKIIFLANPNNPTANLLNREEILSIIRSFPGLVVVDEAYIDFSGTKSFLEEISEFKNLVVLQTFSKAWGMAGVRLGMCFADEEIIAILNKIKFPYNINVLTQEAVSKALEGAPSVRKWVKEILGQRTDLKSRLEELTCVLKVYPSDANFFLVKVDNGRRAYEWLLKRNIIVRDRSSTPRCENCLRVTVGTAEENKRLINALKDYEKSSVY